MFVNLYSIIPHHFYKCHHWMPVVLGCLSVDSSKINKEKTVLVWFEEYPNFARGVPKTWNFLGMWPKSQGKASSHMCSALNISHSCFQIALGLSGFLSAWYWRTTSLEFLQQCKNGNLWFYIFAIKPFHKLTWQFVVVLDHVFHPSTGGPV